MAGRGSCTLALLAVAACGGAPEALDCDDPASPTWNNFAEGYVQTWCTPCHTAALTGDARQGAPSTVNYDTYADVASYASQVRVWATGDAPAMPPLGGTDPRDVARLAAWLDCGAPGGDPTPDPCVDAPARAAAVVAGQADADALCAPGMGIPASLTVSGSAAIDCVCGVGGDLTVEGGQVSLPRLASVGGDGAVTAQAQSLSAPQLRQVDGGLRVDAAALTELDVRGLEGVGGALDVHGVTGLARLELLGLQRVGSLAVQGLPDLQVLRLPRLRTVEGDLIVRDLPALRALAETNAVERVGGDLVLDGLGVPTFDHWTFSFLAWVGGSVRITNNPAATDIGGFTLLGDPFPYVAEPVGIGGDLWIEGNPTLRGITGFDTLRAVPGDLMIGDNAVLEGILGLKNLAEIGGALILDRLPALDVITGLEPLAQVGGDLVIVDVDGLAELDAFPTLSAVTGALELRGNDALVRIRGLDALASVGSLGLADHAALTDLGGLSALTGVLGPVAIEGNGVLAELQPLHGIDAIGGAVTVRNNPSLPRAVIDAWIDAVDPQDIAGTVTIEGNAP